MLVLWCGVVEYYCATTHLSVYMMMSKEEKIWSERGNCINLDSLETN